MRQPAPDWYLAPPRSIYYCATYDCPRYCAYCNLHAMVKALYGSHKKARQQEMGLPTVKRVLAEAGDTGVELCKIGGGEPFTRSDIFDIIEYGVQLGMTLVPVSRHVFTQQQAERLAATGVDTIAFSVDSLRAETNLTLHRDSSLGDSLFEGIERVASCGVKPYVTVVVTRFNEGEYEDLVRAFQGVGVRGVSPTMLVGPTFTLQSGPCGSFDESLCIERSGLFQREGELLEINERLGVSSEIPDVDRQFSDVCPSADMAFISPDGSMSYCGQTTDLFFGNVKHRSLMEVWTSPERQRLLRPPRELYAGTECEACDSFDTCGQLGRCYFATMKQGPFHRPESNRLCRRVRERVSAIGAAV